MTIRTICLHGPESTGKSTMAPLLAKHFLARFAKDMNPQVKGFTPEALAAIGSPSSRPIPSRTPAASRGRPAISRAAP